MIRSVLVLTAIVATNIPTASACDAVVAVAPSAFVGSAVYAPLAVSVAPVAVFAPLAVEVDTFAVSVAPFGARVFAAPVRVRACVGPRARFFPRQARSRVIVRVR